MMTGLSRSAVRAHRPAIHSRRRLSIEFLESRDVPSTLVPLGPEFTVVTDGGGYALSSTDVDANPSGQTVVAWNRYDLKGIWVQRYEADGSAVGGPLTIVSTEDDFLSHSNVAIDASGDFVVTWQLALLHPPTPDPM